MNEDFIAVSGPQILEILLPSIPLSILKHKLFTLFCQLSIGQTVLLYQPALCLGIDRITAVIERLETSETNVILL